MSLQPRQQSSYVVPQQQPTIVYYEKRSRRRLLVSSVERAEQEALEKIKSIERKHSRVQEGLGACGDDVMNTLMKIGVKKAQCLGLGAMPDTIAMLDAAQQTIGLAAISAAERAGREMKDLIR